MITFKFIRATAACRFYCRPVHDPVELDCDRVIRACVAHRRACFRAITKNRAPSYLQNDILVTGGEYNQYSQEERVTK